jgi:hypothetical protein
MPESTQIIVSRRNIRHNIHSTTDRQPVLFLRGPGGIVQSGFEALLEGSGRVFYQAPDLVDTHQPPVLIETEGTVLLDGGEPSETLSSAFTSISNTCSRIGSARVLGPSLIVYSNCKPQPCGARVWLKTCFPIEADGGLVPERLESPTNGA